MKQIIFTLLAITYYQYAKAQHKEGFNWITGTTDCRVSFNTIDSTPSTFKVVNYNTMFLQGSSCISDSNGKFLFSCDGYRIWDTSGNMMDNGDSLCPSKIMDDQFVSSLTQTSLILPFSDGIYYEITPTVSDTTFNAYWNNTSGIAPFDLLLYHKIDMKENGGAGEVIKKAIPLLKNTFISKSQMQACRHSNGVDWWLLKQALDSNIIYRFLFTKDSIYGPFIQNFMPFRFGIYDNYGQSCFSQEGTKYAITQPDIPASLGLGGMHDNAQLFIADFNRCTGELTSPKVFNIPNFTAYSTYIDSFYGGLGDHGGTGVCFSENEKYLYVAKFTNLFQFEISEPDSALAWYHVAGLDTTYFAFQRYQGLYRGPDHKIYIGNVGGSTKQMSVINKPELKGALCEFCPRCLRFPFTGISAPPNMPDYTLGASGATCWPVSSGEILDKSNEMVVYPNPASDEVMIESESLRNKDYELNIFNLLGETVLEQKGKSFSDKLRIDISSLPRGVYMLRVNEFVRRVVKE